MLLIAAAVGWAGLIVLTPRWAQLGGTGQAAARAAEMTAAVVRVVGAHVCHQRPERSFHVDGRALPVCGRCTGLYLAGAVGLLGAAFGRRCRPRHRRAAPAALAPWWPGVLDPRALGLVAAALPTLVTWSLEVVGLWNPGTPLRALAALPLGLVAGWSMGRALRQ